ncbi:MAG: hypothetical protein IT215_07190 [Chitinophagaceae bacterium]|nr:hypothetical protein [Chitinophagaceae bacterium]HMN32428.1 hypothetical protein [Chitinophagaceae bacterium]
MKKQFYFLTFLILSAFMFSCTSTKSTADSISKEQRKKEKEEKRLAREKEKNAPPIQENTKPILKPTTTPNNTVPRKLVNE